MKNLHIAGICGHFAFETELFNGQTIKTKIIAGELEKQLGADDVCCVDTYGGAKRLPIIMTEYIGLFLKCKNIIILPAQNGLKLFVPLSILLNILFRRKLHYVVIGGWLAEYLNAHRLIAGLLKRFDNIYVETSTMKKALEKTGLKNVVVMPNCKELKILDESSLQYKYSEPLKLCTFSRVMQQKGIEDAIYAVRAINEKYKRIVYCLDIYGQVDEKQQTWFNSLQKSFPDYVNYKGSVMFEKSVETLKDYFALLFPTHYYTEGIPGTIIDAFSSGLPVIASRWESFNDIIDDGITGIGYRFSDKEALKDVLLDIVENKETVTGIKKNCISRAADYLPANVIQILIERLL